MSSNSSISELDFKCWQDMARPDKINELLNGGLLADCEFLVGPEESTAEIILGHKVMFVLESPVLEKMLIGDFIEAGKNHKIRIDDVLPQDFKNFRHVIYHNDYSKYSKLSLEEIFELYRIADKYLVSSICRDAMQFLKCIVTKSIDVDRLMILFEYASEQKDKSLLSAIEKEISQRDIGCILKSSRVNLYSKNTFYDLILCVTKLPTPPTSLIIFNAIESYFNQNHLIENNVKICTSKDVKENKRNSVENNQVQKTVEMEKFKEKKEVQKTVELEKFKGKKEVQKTVDEENLTNKEVQKGEQFDDISVFQKYLFQLVKFDKMSANEFINGPGKSDLLGVQRKYEMLAYMLK